MNFSVKNAEQKSEKSTLCAKEMLVMCGFRITHLEEGHLLLFRKNVGA